MNLSPVLILASGSPRRAQLLAKCGITHIQMPADIYEADPLPDCVPEEYVRDLAYEKACHVQKLKQNHPVVGADTVVCINGKILGKPLDQNHAQQMLKTLSGNTHIVLTGVCFLSPSKKPHQFIEQTEVRFRQLNNSEIAWYLASNEWTDKAGGYGIQGMGGALISGINGCYYNVVGLPIARLLGYLAIEHPLIWPGSP